MTNVLNIRGTNGTGKTTLAAIFARGERRQITTYHHHKDWPGYVHFDEENGIVVVGEYRDGQCGGCDKVKTQDGVQTIVRAALTDLKPRGLVFEGLLVSGLYGRYYELDRELKAQGHSYLWGFLRPGTEEAMRRVQGRSARTYEGEGLTKLFGNVDKKRIAVDQVHAKAVRDGLDVWEMPTGRDDAGLPLALPAAKAYLLDGVRPSNTNVSKDI